MTIFFFIALAILAFFVGFIFGNRDNSSKNHPSKDTPRLLMGIDDEEYKNFLSYDGTEQI